MISSLKKIIIIIIDWMITTALSGTVVSLRVWSFNKFSSYLVISYSFKVQLTALATVLAFSL